MTTSNDRTQSGPSTIAGPAHSPSRRGVLGAAAAAGTVVTAAGALSVAQVAQAQTQPAPARPADNRPVITRQTGRVQGQVTALGLGTFLTFDLLPGSNREPLRQVTKAYLDAGVRVLDTSPLYGTGEVSLGAFLAERGGSDDLFVSNKIWSTGDYLADESHALRSFEQSQLRLWRRQMDVMFCHSLVNVDIAVPTLNAWKREGRVRMVGISHHENPYHEIISGLLERLPIDAVQINYSIFNRNAENRIFAVAADKGQAVFINMAMEKGRLHKIVQGQRLPDFAKEFGAENWSQFFLKWVMGDPRVTCCLTATSNPEHAAENIGALRGPLPDAAMRRRMVQHMETIPGFNTLASLPWYPDKQAQYQGVIRREQARMRQRLS
jgi:diketogulonate reductase-like aldo/keto reductase